MLLAPRARRFALSVLAPAAAATACLSVPAPPGQTGDAGPGDPIDAGDDVRPAPALALIGDVFYLPFEDEDTRGVLRDRSGAGRHAFILNSTEADGFHGRGRGFSGAERALLADHPALLPEALTLEAWVYTTGTGAQAIVSDHSMLGKGTWAELSFELTPVGGGFGLYFATNDCESIVAASVVEELVVPERWAHVAVTWDRTELQFYVDGNPVHVEPTPFAFQPCDAGVPIMPLIGRRPLGDRGMVGRLDELKLSSRVKTADEIRASMNFDPTAAYPSCGDGVAEESEPCDSDDPCCAGCQLLPDGSACTGGRTCAAGRCTSGAPARAEDGLASLFEFSADAPLADTAPGAPAGTLTLEGVDAVVEDGILTVQAGSAAVTGSTDHIASACAESDEVSLEAWLEPLSLTQSGLERPGRIITFSTSTTLRNVTLGQDGRLFELRVRSSHSEFNGMPPGGVEAVEAGRLTHVVATRAADGTRKIYVDGIRRDTSLVLGDMNWASGYPLRLGSEVGGERPWAGRYHLVAIYCRALSVLEIADHVAVGSGD